MILRLCCFALSVLIVYSNYLFPGSASASAPKIKPDADTICAVTAATPNWPTYRQFLVSAGVNV